MAALNGQAAQSGRRPEGPPDAGSADREANTCTVCLENECDIVFQVKLKPACLLHLRCAVAEVADGPHQRWKHHQGLLRHVGCAHVATLSQVHIMSPRRLKMMPGFLVFPGMRPPVRVRALLAGPEPLPNVPRAVAAHQGVPHLVWLRYRF